MNWKDYALKLREALQECYGQLNETLQVFKVPAPEDSYRRYDEALSLPIPEDEIPEGWSLVPKEPTEEMNNAGELAASRMISANLAECMGGLGGSMRPEELDPETAEYLGREYPSVQGMYQAMIQAAPKPPVKEE